MIHTVKTTLSFLPPLLLAPASGQTRAGQRGAGSHELVTGAIPRNMELALRKNYDAVRLPKLAIAPGACAMAGGPHIDCPGVLNGAPGVLPVDLYNPGCPLHPTTVLDAILRLVVAIEREE